MHPGRKVVAWAAEWDRNMGLGWVWWGQGWQGVEDTEHLGQKVLSGLHSKSFLVTPPRRTWRGGEPRLGLPSTSEPHGSKERVSGTRCRGRSLLCPDPGIDSQTVRTNLPNAAQRAVFLRSANSRVGSSMAESQGRAHELAAEARQGPSGSRTTLWSPAMAGRAWQGWEVGEASLCGCQGG